jgi:hypothetical protein
MEARLQPPGPAYLHYLHYSGVIICTIYVIQGPIFELFTLFILLTYTIAALAIYLHYIRFSAALLTLFDRRYPMCVDVIYLLRME